MIITDKYDLTELAEKAGSKLHQAGDEYRGNCPLHGGHGMSNFAIYRSGGKQRYTCYSGDCGSGDAIDFVMKWKDCDLQTAIRFLGGNVYNDPREYLRIASEREERIRKEREEIDKKYLQAKKDLTDSNSLYKYSGALEFNDHARDLWSARGIPLEWQYHYKVGYCNAFRVSTNAGIMTTPSLTIPVYGKNWELLNIRHRLLNNVDPNDKYRPDRPGLSAQPFMSDPDNGYDVNNILVVEGEIKSMVTHITLNSAVWQVIGIPGKGQFRKIADKITGKRVVICLDPDADQHAHEAAKLVNGKIIRLRMKIDDAILAGALNQDGLRKLIKGAVKP